MLKIDEATLSIPLNDNVALEIAAAYIFVMIHDTQPASVVAAKSASACNLPPLGHGLMESLQSPLSSCSIIMRRQSEGASVGKFSRLVAEWSQH